MSGSPREEGEPPGNPSPVPPDDFLDYSGNGFQGGNAVDGGRNHGDTLNEPLYSIGDDSDAECLCNSDHDAEFAPDHHHGNDYDDDDYDDDEFASYDDRGDAAPGSLPAAVYDRSLEQEADLALAIELQIQMNAEGNHGNGERSGGGRAGRRGGPSRGQGRSQDGGARGRASEERHIQEAIDHQLAMNMGTEEDRSDNESSPLDLSNHRCQHGPHDHDHDHPVQEFESSLFRQERRLIAAGRPGGSGFHNFFGFPVQSASRRVHGVLPTTSADNDDAEGYEELLALEERQGEVKQRGLDTHQFQRLPTSKYTEYMGKKSGVSICKVCLEELKVDQQLCTLPCCHFFHFHCAQKWLQINAVCPVCRIEVKEQLR